MPWYIQALLYFTDHVIYMGGVDTPYGIERVTVLGHNRFYTIVERRDGRYSILLTKGL